MNIYNVAFRSSIDFSDWDIDGKELCALTHDDFKLKVKTDLGDLFWTHLVTKNSNFFRTSRTVRPNWRKVIY